MMRQGFAYDHLTISQVCKHYSVSRQAFYKSRQRAKQVKINHKKLYGLIIEQRKRLPREGGHKLYKRIRPQLEALGLKIGRDKLFAFLRQEDLLVKRKKSFVKTTNSLHRFHAYGNLTMDFTPTQINQLWVCDLTYIRTQQGFMYLALITDAYSRKILGYDVRDNLELNGCVQALNMALKQLTQPYELIHHSDRGIQYCSHIYTNILKSKNIKISMASKGNCYENALAERMNGILKDEFYLDQNFLSKKVAEKACVQAICLYNSLRTHMSINYKTPNQVHQLGLSTY